MAVYPLIEIKTVPIEIEMKTTRARMELSRGTAEVQISRDRGGLNIHSRPIRVKIDTFEARNSVSPTTMRSIEQAAQMGQQAAYEATATYASEGQLLLKSKVGEDALGQMAASRQASHIKTNVGVKFLPTAPAKLSWDIGEVSVRYEMDKLNFNWKVDNGDFKFVPADVEFSITQMPDVIIKYVGGPVYVPPSAEPGYVDVNV